MPTKATILALVAVVTLAALFVLQNQQTPAQVEHETLFASISECKKNCLVLKTNNRFVETQYKPCLEFCSGQPDVLSNPTSCFNKCKELCEGGQSHWPRTDCFYDCSLTCMYNPILHRSHGAPIKGFWQDTANPDSIWHLGMDSLNTFTSLQLSPRAQFFAKHIRGDVNPDDSTKGTLTIRTPKNEDVTYNWEMEDDGKHFSLVGDAPCMRAVRVNGQSEVVKKAMAEDFVSSDVTVDGATNVAVTKEMEEWLTGKWTLEMTRDSREYEGTIVRPDTDKNFFKMKIEKNWSKKFIQDFELRFTSPKEGVMSVMYHSKKMDVPFVFDAEDKMRFFNQDGSLRALGTKTVARA